MTKKPLDIRLVPFLLYSSGHTLDILTKKEYKNNEEQSFEDKLLINIFSGLIRSGGKLNFSLINIAAAFTVAPTEDEKEEPVEEPSVTEINTHLHDLFETTIGTTDILYTGKRIINTNNASFLIPTLTVARYKESFARLVVLDNSFFGRVEDTNFSELIDEINLLTLHRKDNTYQRNVIKLSAALYSQHLNQVDSVITLDFNTEQKLWKKKLEEPFNRTLTAKLFQQLDTAYYLYKNNIKIYNPAVDEEYLYVSVQKE